MAQGPAPGADRDGRRRRTAVSAPRVWRRPAARGRPSLVIAPRPDYDTAESRTVYRPGPRRGGRAARLAPSAACAPGRARYREARDEARARGSPTPSVHTTMHTTTGGLPEGLSMPCQARASFLQAARQGVRSWGRAILLKSLSSTLDYDRHYTTMHSRWTIGRQAGLRRVPEILTSWPARYGVTAVSARTGGGARGSDTVIGVSAGRVAPSWPPPFAPYTHSHSSLTHMIYQLSRFPRAARLIHGLKCMMHVAAYDRRINVQPRNRVYICINAS